MDEEEFKTAVRSLGSHLQSASQHWANADIDSSAWQSYVLRGLVTVMQAQEPQFVAVNLNRDEGGGVSGRIVVYTDKALASVQTSVSAEGKFERPTFEVVPRRTIKRVQLNGLSTDNFSAAPSGYSATVEYAGDLTFTLGESPRERSMLVDFLPVLLSDLINGR